MGRIIISAFICGKRKVSGSEKIITPKEDFEIINATKTASDFDDSDILRIEKGQTL